MEPQIPGSLGIFRTFRTFRNIPEYPEHSGPEYATVAALSVVHLDRQTDVSWGAADASQGPNAGLSLAPHQTRATSGCFPPNDGGRRGAWRRRLTPVNTGPASPTASVGDGGAKGPAPCSDQLKEGGGYAYNWCHVRRATGQLSAVGSCPPDPRRADPVGSQPTSVDVQLEPVGVQRVHTGGSPRPKLQNH